VTGSCHLLECAGCHVLFDGGLYRGEIIATAATCELAR
jgi:hypothetical protein